ncbi:putative unusual protein kinase [Halomicronema hongdechloris C2206]|uniref:Unusual protein kinase n=1 Tax=Halomicronema hongdechloris C2206 TaxID=1641165 RepID=A0A1Z3HN28_9CYAN|nr:AarF/ABC1/UbiB kinase family protein [Halomicronema hongdechloris]ASC71699.1 putative unusual protein kinase [Halomicronema hongdechloris C2206]
MASPHFSGSDSPSATVTVASEPVVDDSGALAPFPASSGSAGKSIFEQLRVYDPDAIAAYYRRRPWQIVWRFLSILWPFATFYLTIWWDRRQGKSEQRQRQRAVQLRELLTDLGPAYIKVGQALSTRPDLVPPIFLDELSSLQDQLPPFANELAYHFIETELGAPPDEVYADLTPDPVAAASLGQVYKGRLHSGEVVAVKVQRPDLAQRITLDVYILRLLAQLGTDYIPQIRSDLVGIMDEFGARIFEEMDYAHEAQNAERFAKLYGHLNDIYVPRIYRQYTRRRVLTMEWIDGTKLTKLSELQTRGIDATHLIEIGVQCSLRQLLEHGFFHADPHPGNLLATADGKLAYLDFGMMSQVKPYQRYGLIEAVVHMVNRDFEGLAQDYIKLEFLTPDTDLRPIIPALAEVFNNALGASVAELNFKSITDEFSALMYEYPFRVPAYYALIIRSLVTLEGIAINVDPNFKVLSKAYPYVSKRLLTDPAPELRTSLRELLFKDDRFRWNRLENLLRNARNSEDYDLAKVLDQTIEFLYSERGRFIRDRIAAEAVRTLDQLGQHLPHLLSHTLYERFGWGEAPAQAETAGKNGAPPAEEDWQHIVNILAILRDTEGFDPTLLASRLPDLLMRPETHSMGQRIVGDLAQRTVARWLRGWLLADADADEQRPIPERAALPASTSS